MKRLLAALTLTICVTACGGGDSGSQTSDLSTFADTATMAKALDAAGIQCDEFALDDPDSQGDFDIGLPEATETGSCTSEGDTLQLSIFAKPEQVTTTVKAIGSPLICGFAKSFGVSHLALAFGANWTLDGMSDDPAVYAKAIGGDSATYECPED